MARKKARTAETMAAEQEAKLAALDNPGEDTGEAPEKTEPEKVEAQDKPPVDVKPKEIKPEKKVADDNGATNKMVGELQAQIDTLNANYGELRSHSTKIEQDNSLLRSEIDLYRMQGQQGQSTETSETEVETTPETIVTPEVEQTVDPLQALSADFPEIVGPIRSALENVLNPLQEQLAAITGQVRAVSNNLTLTKEQQDRQDQENAERVHFKTIQDTHPDWQKIVNSESYKEWLFSLPGGQRSYALTYPQADGDPGLSALEMVDYISSFKKNSPEYQASLDEQEESNRRLAEAEADSEGNAIVTGGPTATGTEADRVEVVRMSEIREARQANDPGVLAALLEKAALAADYNKLEYD